MWLAFIILPYLLMISPFRFTLYFPFYISSSLAHQEGMVRESFNDIDRIDLGMARIHIFFSFFYIK